METQKEGNGSEFHVLLSGMKLSAKLENKIALRIQAAVSSVLSDYPNPDDPDGNDGPAGGGGRGPFPGGGGLAYVAIPSIRWKGYWIKALGKDFRINPAEIDLQQVQLQKGIQAH